MSETRGTELSLLKEEKSERLKKFLELSVLNSFMFLEKNPEFFGLLKGENSPEVISRLVDLVKLTAEGYPEMSLKLSDLLREIYESLESKEEPEYLQCFLSEEEKQAVTKHTFALEMTEGCSGGCHFCGFSAKKGVKSYMSFGDMICLARKYHLSPRLLFYASEMMDWKEGKRDCVDVLDMFSFFGEHPPSVTVSYPEGSKELLERMLRKRHVDHFSLGQHNLDRLIRDGWIKKEGDGYLSTNPLLGTVLSDVHHNLDVIYENVGRNYRENDRNRVGGIGCSVGVLLRAEEGKRNFYNVVFCKPDKEHKEGQIVKKINSKKIEEKLDIERDWNIEELLDYCVVHRLYDYGFQQHDQNYSIVVSNFYDGKENFYFVRYDVNTGQVSELTPVENDEEKEAKILAMVGNSNPELLKSLFYKLLAFLPKFFGEKLGNINIDSNLFQRSVELASKNIKGIPDDDFFEDFEMTAINMLFELVNENTRKFIGYYNSEVLKDTLDSFLDVLDLFFIFLIKLFSKNKIKRGMKEDEMKNWILSIYKNLENKLRKNGLENDKISFKDIFSRHTSKMESFLNQ